MSREEFDRRLLHIRAAVKKAAPGLEKSVHDSRRAEYFDSTQTAILQAIYALQDGQEGHAPALGPPPGPTLGADSLHPTVWDAARSFWRSNHRSQAVEQAAKSVNAALQDRLGRRDVDNTKLVQEAFSLNAPEPGKPRLRVWPERWEPDLQEHACRCGVVRSRLLDMARRNPAAHEDAAELPEQEALEQLAAFSVLARWVESAELVTAE